MIIEVNGKYTYNAPASVKVGDRVKLPHTQDGDPFGRGHWYGTVTRAPGLPPVDYDGTIAAVLDVQPPVTARVAIDSSGIKVFHAATPAELADMVSEWIEENA